MTDLKPPDTDPSPLPPESESNALAAIDGLIAKVRRHRRYLARAGETARALLGEPEASEVLSDEFAACGSVLGVIHHGTAE